MAAETSVTIVGSTSRQRNSLLARPEPSKLNGTYLQTSAARGKARLSQQGAGSALTAAEKLKRRSKENAGLNGRQRSLRKVKKDDDLTQEVSLKVRSSKHGEMLDDSTAGRAGKQFTVANVGSHGMIYLRPTKRTVQPVVTPSPGPALTSHPPEPVFVDREEERNMNDGRDSVWTHLSPSRKAGSMADSDSIHEAWTAKPQRSVSPASEPGSDAVKIVIDRPNNMIDGPHDADNSFPSLEVPIPHYRLGTPRFSARGTAFLHHSVHTRSSTDDGASSVFSAMEYDRLFPKPPGIDQRSLLTRRYSQTTPQSLSISENLAQVPVAATPPVPLFHEKTAIVPQIYDSVAANPNDPAIVRYSPTGDIAAASPARIIAQITSENFLDYELLSDFFLTVRIYLSTQDLLSYLLARFEWAINRFDDNGRVIRVRAFAALRHWILNYFSYDFAVDRDLRVQFCDRLNMLTRVVEARANYGASDMKLISDLKKCWNGRCLLFWDTPSTPAELSGEMDILPGGIVGSRDSTLTHASQLPHNASGAPVDLRSLSGRSQIETGAAISEWYQSVLDHGEAAHTRTHSRANSGVTVRSLPISPTSEMSNPVLSCSIPIAGKGFRRVAAPSSQTHNRPMPHPAEGRRTVGAQAPSALVTEDGPRSYPSSNRRSGSSSDVAREHHAPASSEAPSSAEASQPIIQSFGGGLVRGNVVAPRYPFVHFSAPNTPALDISHLAMANDVDGHRRLGGPSNPGVKQFIGSIRRALGSKPGGNSASTLGATGTSAHSLAGSNGAPSMNVIYQAASTGQLASFRSIRIDTLASQVAEVYRQATAERASQEALHQPTIGITPASQTPPTGRPLATPQASQSLLPPPAISQAHSGISSASQSIMIMDDTALEGSDPSSLVSVRDLDSRLAPPTSATNQRFGEPSQAPASTVLLATVGIPGSNASHTANSELDSCAEPNQMSGSPSYSTSSEASRPSVLFRGHSHKSTKSGSLSLRKYASFQSTFHRQAGDGDTNAGSVRLSHSHSDHPPQHVLRRRPGGDLRANQNVHDLEEHSRPRSTGSITTYVESLNNAQPRTLPGQAAPLPPRSSSRSPQQLEAKGQAAKRATSLVRTHSSQPELRRPSFEAAVAEFSRIPDDDEGGIEATLLKLEGKYQKSPVQSATLPTFPGNVSRGDGSSRTPPVHRPASPPKSSEAATKAANPWDASNHESDRADHASTPHENAQKSTREKDSMAKAAGLRGTITSTLYADSEGSYNLTPLLERDLMETPVPGDSESRASFDSDEQSFTRRFLRHRGSGMLRHGSLAPTATTDSFLLDESDGFLSDSSIMSTEMPNDSDLDDDDPHLMSRQPEEYLPGQHPPSPPMTMENARSISAQARQARMMRQPPTPDPSPDNRHSCPKVRNGGHCSRPISEVNGKRSRGPRHMPFILGYEAELLAQQFTIVEKDALNEIDWRDLVDMRWQNAALTVTNWVDYLCTQDAQGIDLVTARFNLMVKWTLSEIVLTESIDERAMCIVKFIQIAKEARKIHNYATMLQLTIALTSMDCTRLTKTWKLVPAADKQSLKELEALVSPRRNFNELRVEMEKVSADEGCIPVVALYIHDLTYNSQKPSQVASTRTGESLINFERYRCTALIVKNLLRLIDASSKYSYQAIEAAIEKCLWVACLTDEEITSRSKTLEAT